MERFVRETAPHVIFHLATASRLSGRENESWLVNYEWTSELAWIARENEITFIFTSSVMVWTDQAKGPFRPGTPPDAAEGYGAEKHRAEARVFHQYPEGSRVARLGWQIGWEPGGNHMVDQLESQAKNEGVIRASTRWLPACSFLEDTAAALVRLIEMPPGLYLFDSNEKWNFHEIVSALNRRLKAGWNIEATEDFVYDQRMFDDRPGLPPLSEKLDLE